MSDNFIMINVYTMSNSRCFNEFTRKKLIAFASLTETCDKKYPIMTGVPSYSRTATSTSRLTGDVLQKVQDIIYKLWEIKP